MQRALYTLNDLSRQTYENFSLRFGVKWSTILHVSIMLLLALDYILWSRAQPIVLGAPVEIIMDDKLPSQKEALGRHTSKLPLPPKVEEKFKPTPPKPAQANDPDAYRSQPAPKKPTALPTEKKNPAPLPKAKPKIQGALKNAQDVTTKPSEKANVRRGDAEGTENDDEIRQVLMRQFNACWNKETFMHVPNATEFVVIVSLVMNQNGTVQKASISSPKNPSDPMYQVAVDEARNAVLDPRCQPIPLPAKKYSRWKELELVFDPKVMG